MVTKQTVRKPDENQQFETRQCNLSHTQVANSSANTAEILQHILFKCQASFYFSHSGALIKWFWANIIADFDESFDLIRLGQIYSSS